MAKIFTYAGILAGIVGMMTLGGLQGTSVFNLLNLFGFSTTSASNFANSYGWLLIIGTIGGAAAIGGIISGYLGRSISESYVLVPLVVAIGTWFVIDSVSVVNYIWTAYPDMAWLGTILGFVFFVMTVQFSIALISFWRGNDI